MKSSGESEDNHPMKDENVKKVPGYIWRELEMKISRLATDDPFIPGFIGGLLGFWLSTLVFSWDLLFNVETQYSYIAFTLLWGGSLFAYWKIYKKQKQLVLNSRDEILQLMKQSDKENYLK
jgi:hypothetical protein